MGAPLPDSRKREIADAYLSGKSAQEVAVMFGYKSHVSVLKVLRSLNVKARSVGEAMIGTSNARKHSLRQDILSGSVDTEEKAYLLGLLYSDGWISTAQRGRYLVGISSTDLEIITTVRSILKATNPISKNKKYKSSHAQGYAIFACSKLLVSDLKKHGCIENKSHVLRYPHIESDMHRHFIRGLWDGDGSVRFTKTSKVKLYMRVSLVGAIELLKGVRSQIYEACGATGSIRKHGSVFRLSYAAGAESVHAYLYENSLYKLTRKAVPDRNVNIYDKRFDT